MDRLGALRGSGSGLFGDVDLVGREVREVRGCTLFLLPLSGGGTGRAPAPASPSKRPESEKAIYLTNTTT